MATRNLTGDDYRRAKELEEARKAGLAPAALDEDGKEINPHIPEYMTSAPWYLNKDQPTLVHQRNWRNNENKESKWYDRGVKVFQATKFRKGACENCGSMTHKTQDCLERPRAKGAKWTNKNIAADEKVEDIQPDGFDAKRDRWNGYETKDYDKVVERYEKLEEYRKEIKQKEEVSKMYGGAKAEKVAEADADADGGGDDDDDDAKIGDDEDAGFGEVKKRVRTTAGGSTGSVRNLRIREDTAKYLLNLDPNSAYYDPKSRSMREDPNPEKPDNEKTFRGDNYARKNGDYLAWQQLAVHSMDAFDKGADIHMLANPSMAETLYKQFKEKKEKLTHQSKEEIAEKYGSASEKAPEELREMVATERYVEYDRMGRVVKGQENKAKSRYEEDVMINNHTSVWGSWWKDGVWGFACCHQTTKNSYCTGRAGEAAAAESAAALLQNMEAKAQHKAEEDAEKRKNSKLNDYKGYSGQGVWGTETADPDKINQKKVEEALKKLEAAEKAAEESGEDKRKFNSLDAASENITAEEMEAYRIKKMRHDDPMVKPKAGDKQSSMGTGKEYEFL